ncbi:MAG: hypothetical protein H0T79_16380 [Deltaproteobacteria bacterium]|nr:hypothetical protein [Deltaproteobacteria bacterium]
MERGRNELHMVKRLETAVGDRLISVIAYGPIAHEDEYFGGEHLLIVIADLEPDTLRRLGEPVSWWLAKGEPWPRLFSPELLQTSIDVFPIEILDIAGHRRIVFGSDALANVEVDPVYLRAQCERELREKLMRLREGYVECHGTDSTQDLRELLATSFAAFARIFRGCLHLLGAPRARQDRDIVIALCARLDLPAEAFLEIERLARGGRSTDPEAAFIAYYEALAAAERRIDQLIIQGDQS